MPQPAPQNAPPFNVACIPRYFQQDRPQCNNKIEISRRAKHSVILFLSIMSIIISHIEQEQKRLCMQILMFSIVCQGALGETGAALPPRV
jgi:hypothetical protein